MEMLGPPLHRKILDVILLTQFWSPLLKIPPCRLPRLYRTPSGPRNLPTAAKIQSKGIIFIVRMPSKHQRRLIPKRRPPLPPVLLPRRNKAAIQPDHLANDPAKRVAVAAPAAQKASARVVSTMRPMTGNASSAPSQAKPSPWQQSIS